MKTTFYENYEFAIEVKLSNGRDAIATCKGDFDLLERKITNWVMILQELSNEDETDGPLLTKNQMLAEWDGIDAYCTTLGWTYLEDEILNHDGSGTFNKYA